MKIIQQRNDQIIDIPRELTIFLDLSRNSFMCRTFSNTPPYYILGFYTKKYTGLYKNMGRVFFYLDINIESYWTPKIAAGF